VAAATAVWLAFTGARVARADEARWPGSGPGVRAGTAVGFSQLGDQTVTTLGGELGLGYRIGRLTLEAQYDGLHLLEYVADRGSNAYRGELARYGVAARVFFLDLGGGADADWMWRLYAEIGAGRQLGRWSSGDQFARNDLATGAGWLLEHRMRPRPGGLPFRSFGWHFGWQLETARTGRVQLVAERTTCKTCGPPMPGRDLDASLVVSCAFLAAW